MLYAREYGLDTTFEPYVAKPLAEFVLQRRGAAMDRGGGRAQWSARSPWSMPGEGEGQLRWFLLVPEARGSGLGKRLLETALAYARERGFRRIFLWTFADLDGALRLYERAGFRITETKTGFVWGAERTEVRMDLDAVGACAAQRVTCWTLTPTALPRLRRRPARSAPS